MENKPKSVNALMKYLRDDKLISIQGSRSSLISVTIMATKAIDITSALPIH